MTFEYGDAKTKRGLPKSSDLLGDMKSKQGQEATNSSLKNAMLDVFMEGLSATVENRINELVLTGSANILGDIEEKLRVIEQNKSIHIHHDNGKIAKFEDTVHERFEVFAKTLSTRLPVMLVGPAGTGKTFAAWQASKVMDVPFYAISVGAQTSKSDIGGYMNAVGTYVTSQFREAYEKGGIFLMDEIDAGNSNVLIFINAALSSNECAFPDGMITKHENFYFVSTANTYGLGANRQYVGRNQLDAATLDRFVVLDWPIDSKLERSIITSTKHGLKWLAVVQSVRALVEKSEYRIVISPRATIKGATMLEVDIPFNQVVQSVLLSQTSADQREKIEQCAQKAWGF